MTNADALAELRFVRRGDLGLLPELLRLGERLEPEERRVARRRESGRDNGAGAARRRGRSSTPEMRSRM